MPLLILALFAFSPFFITHASVVLASEDRVLTLIRFGLGIAILGATAWVLTYAWKGASRR